MADSIDQAQIENERHLELALARRVVFDPAKPSANDCVECCCEIPKARRAAIPGVETCVDCQSLIELRSKR